MLVIIGWLVVSGAVFGGFVLAGGHIAALLQPVELLMIGGAAGGAFLVANPPKVVKGVLKTVPQIFKGSHYTQKLYMELLSLLYELLVKMRKEGMLAIERDVDEPHQSALFMKYPMVLADHHLIEFITDYLRLLVGGTLNTMELENLMDNEIETHHHEGEVPVHALSKLADAMPAFGIVAAVMGVVHTMESVDLPPAELGILVAHALVGTFLGILIGYGFVGPVAVVIEHRVADATKALQCIKVVLLAGLNDYVPQVAVEFGRKVLYSTERPTYKELEDEIRQRKGK